MAAATTSEEQVCNLALLYVGNGQTIDSLAENTQEAKACAIVYPKARDELLEAFPWKFASKRVVLALLTGEARSGWAYTYGYPADCLAPRAIYPGGRMVAAESKIPFDVETVDSAGHPGSLCIVTDEESAELLYTVQTKAVGLFTPLFVDALAWRIAMKLALVLPVKPALAAQIEVKAKAAFATAAASQLRGVQEDVEPPSEYTSER